MVCVMPRTPIPQNRYATSDELAKVLTRRNDSVAKNDVIMSLEDLKTYFRSENGLVKAVDRVNFDVRRSESVGVVGESCCNKSVTCLHIMQLVRRPRGNIEGGKILYNRQDGSSVDIAKLNYNGKEMRSIRGNEIAMIFQEPMTSLNPVYTVGRQIMEAVMLHQNLTKKQAKERAIEMLSKVGIPAPKQRVDEYPHQFSGGMRQRAMIAMALSCDPQFLIADEPTTALDVTIEAQILRLMKNIQAEFGVSIMIITHDLGVIAEMADRVNVMYTGKVVEHAGTDDIFHNPQHPYTQGLLNSIPTIGRRQRLTPIKGTVPNLLTLPENVCYFAPRCPHAMDICSKQEPPLFQIDDTHTCKCWLHRGSKEVSA